MSYEAEMPGIKVTREQLQIICNRYYFVAQYVSGKQILEVGCGPGLGLGYLARKSAGVIGGDYTEDNLRVARQHYKGGVELILLDAHNLPFKDECFDVVIALATIIYLRLDRFFAECHRVLRGGGALVFCTPNKDQPGFHRSALSRNYFSVPDLALLANRYFDARFFGAFPAPKTRQRIVNRYRNAVVTGIAKTLDRIPRGTDIKGFISKSIFSNPAFPLVAEIEEGMVEYVPPEPIRSDIPDVQHRIVYAVAYAR